MPKKKPDKKPAPANPAPDQPEPDILHVFETLGLATDEERRRILALKELAQAQAEPEETYDFHLSNTSDDEIVSSST